MGTATSSTANDQAANISNNNETDTTAPSATSSPPPLIYAPQTSNQLHYLQSTYDLRTLKTALNSNVKKNNSGKSTSSTNNIGPTLRFTVVMGHV